MMKQGYVTIPRKPRTGSWAPAVVSHELSTPTSPTNTFEIAEPVYDNLGLRTTAGGSIMNLNKISQTNKGVVTSPGANLKYTMKDRPLPATPAATSGDHHQLNGSMREPLYSSSSNSEKKIPPRPPPKPAKKGVVDMSLMASSNPQRITTNGHYEDEGEDGTEVQPKHKVVFVQHAVHHGCNSNRNMISIAFVVIEVRRKWNEKRVHYSGLQLTDTTIALYELELNQLTKRLYVKISKKKITQYKEMALFSTLSLYLGQGWGTNFYCYVNLT